MDTVKRKIKEAIKIKCADNTNYLDEGFGGLFSCIILYNIFFMSYHSSGIHGDIDVIA